MMKSILVLIFLIAGCSYKKKQIENQVSKGHEELYSSPKNVDADKDGDIRRIVIAATNDIQGSYEAQTLYFKDEHHPKKQSITIGGMPTIESYFSILRQKYANVVLVDSGNIFSSAKINVVKDFYAHLKFDAVTVGLNDFNLKLPSSEKSTAAMFQSFAKNSKTPLLLSNFYELKTARVVEWPGTKPYLMKEFDGVKVGIIGLIPDDIVPQTPVNNRVGYYVENMLQSTLRHARLLRSLGADIIVVLTHQGIECGHEIAADQKLPLMKVNFEPLRPNVCNLKSTMGEYLKRLPPMLVDVVIGGRHLEKMANFINGTLVLSSFGHGKSFSFAEFFVDVKDKKLIRTQTITHQPVMFCQEFFKETNDCYSEDTSVDHKERIPAMFLGEPVITSPTPATSPSLDQKSVDANIKRALEIFNADISFKANRPNDSQLMVVEISGAELIRTMEEDYNLSQTAAWYPTPFLEEKEKIRLMIKGEEIQAHKTYRILSDLSGLQTRRYFRKMIHQKDAQSYPYFSWNELPNNQDELTLSAAAPYRQ